MLQKFREMKFWNHIISPIGILCAILLFAFFLRVSGIDSRDIWYDELLTIQQSEKSISEINKDVPTPIHYYFVHVFMFFGKSTLVLGIPSVILGLFSVLLVFLTAKKIADERTGLIAAFLMAISPMHIEFSQQILFFSYFTFFSSFILYVIMNFALHFEQGKFKWGHLLLLILLNWVNVLTQMLALVLIPVQLLFLCYLFAKNPKVIRVFKKYLVALALFFAALFSVLFSVGSGGYVSFLETLHIGFERPITVGYSLSSQLGSTIIGSPVEFLQAMFSWFGIGGGVGFVVYFFFFIAGLFTLYRRQSFRLAAILLTLWLALPFLVLFSVRIEHWFEEKYFIFMIPAYLIIVGLGIRNLAEFLGEKMERLLKSTYVKNISSFLILLALAGVGILATQPIKTRTSFGFPFVGHVDYSWKKVDQYLKANRGIEDKIFLIKGNATFLDYYREADGEQNEILDENDIVALKPEEYADFVRKQKENFFVAIPDYNYLFLSDITDWQKIKTVGNFGIYKITFKKESPVVLEMDKAGDWGYYEDFRTSRYISQAHHWENIITSYADQIKVPDIEGYNVMTPTTFSDSFIDYKFTLPENARDFFVQSLFSLDNGSHFQILIGENEENLRMIHEQTSDRFAYFNPQIKVVYDTRRSRDIFMRIRFGFDNNVQHRIGGSQLKSFSLMSRTSDGVRFPNDYLIQKSAAGFAHEYGYNAFLEIEKNNKWTQAAVAKDGWIQTNDGFLIRNHGTKAGSPLVLKFDLDKAETYSGSFEIKTFAHHKNPIEISYSFDNKKWEMLEKTNENIFKIHNYDIKSIKGGRFYLKFVTDMNGPSSQIRNIKATFTER